MKNEEIFKKITEAFIDLDDDVLYSLLDEALTDGISTNDIFYRGLIPGLQVATDDFKHGGFLAEMIIAANIFEKAVDKLLPSAETEVPILNCKRDDYSMVVGSVEGDWHSIGKRLICAFLKGVGIKVIDIGENVSAEEFIAAIKRYAPDFVGASTKLRSFSTSACEKINKAMVDAGVREEVFYFAGGWTMDDDWCDKIGADAFGLDCFDTLDKICVLLKSRGHIFDFDKTFHRTPGFQTWG